MKQKFVTNEPLTCLFAGLEQLEVQFVAKFTGDLPGCKLEQLEVQFVAKFTADLPGCKLRAF